MNSPDIEAAFRNLTAGIDLTPPEPESLTPEVHALLDHFFELVLATSRGVTPGSEEYGEALQTICDKITRFVANSETLTLESEVIVKGGTLALLLDESDGSVSGNYLPKDSQFLGSIAGLYVGPIPDETALIGIEEKIESDEENTIDPVIPYGLSIVLGNAVLQDGDGESKPMPEELTVLIPLNYQADYLTTA